MKKSKSVKNNAFKVVAYVIFYCMSYLAGYKFAKFVEEKF